jgi:hypothetical protein
VIHGAELPDNQQGAANQQKRNAPPATRKSNPLQPVFLLINEKNGDRRYQQTMTVFRRVDPILPHLGQPVPERPEAQQTDRHGHEYQTPWQAPKGRGGNVKVARLDGHSLRFQI